jgi:hypothetical protein
MADSRSIFGPRYTDKKFLTTECEINSVMARYQLKHKEFFREQLKIKTLKKF